MMPLARAALCTILLAGLAIAVAPPTDPARGYWPQWRGADRLNVSADKDLLTEWPKEGPPLAWQVEGVGEGVGSVAVVAGRVYVVGQRGRSECMTALDEATGKPIWSVPLGVAVKQHEPMRWLSQRTPLIDGDRAYGFTAAGELVCVTAGRGVILWQKDYAKDFGGRRGHFGWCDQLLIDGPRLVGVPGGKDATVVALDKKTGKTIWKSALGDSAQYVGAVLAGGGGDSPRHYVAVTSGGLVGVSTEGKELWRNTRFANTTANSHTPNAIGDRVFATGNYGRGVVLLSLKKDGEGVKATEEYAQRMAIPSWHEMSAVVGDHAYVGLHAGICCMEWKTGKVVWQEARNRGGLSGPISGAYADGRLYLFNQKGAVALVDADPKGFSLKGKFSVPDVKPRSGATSPVIAGGRLYLRRDDRLFCYRVRKGGGPVETHSHIVPPLPLDARLPGRPDRKETEAIFVPTPAEAVGRMLKLAEVAGKDVVVDLGCGDGRILIAAAKAHGCRAVGYEIDAELVKAARAGAEKEDVAKLVTIEQKDMYDADLSKVDVVVLYLPPPVLRKLLPQLKKLPAGSRVVSHAFEIPGAKPTKVEKVVSKETGLEHTLYLYTTPLGE